jgi:hypothetical protein
VTSEVGRAILPAAAFQAAFRLELASFDVAGILLDVGMPPLGKVVKREDSFTLF